MDAIICQGYVQMISKFQFMLDFYSINYLDGQQETIYIIGQEKLLWTSKEGSYKQTQIAPQIVHPHNRAHNAALKYVPQPKRIRLSAKVATKCEISQW